MKYKMIASDFDGTIFSHRSFTVPERVQNALHRYIREGGKFIITTGRMFTSIRPHLQNLGLHGEVLCVQGAMCYDIDSGKELFNLDMSNQNAYTLTKLAEEHGWIAQIYNGLDMLTERPNPYTEFYKDLCNVTPVYLGEKASEYVRRTGCTLHKIIIMSTPEEAARKIEIIRAACPELDVSQSTPEYIEAVDKRSGKGNAVLAMAARFGLTPADVAAFGDQTNDLSMLRAAAFAACPENAVQAVKDASDVVAKDVEEGGMADVIEWILE